MSSGVGYRLATISRSSRTERFCTTPPVCSIAPTAPLAIACSAVIPKRVTVPESGGSRPSIMSIVVDLPAPLGPSNATVSPGVISMSTPRTAWTGPWGDLNVFVKPRSDMPEVGRDVTCAVMANTLP